MVKVDLRISDTEWKIFHFEGKISRQLILPVGKKNTHKKNTKNQHLDIPFFCGPDDIKLSLINYRRQILLQRVG